jgi:hypothetical protein
MKKHYLIKKYINKISIMILFIMLITGLQAQKSIAWDSIQIPITDTTIVFSSDNERSAYCVTINFKMTGLDSSVIVHPGGADSKLNSTVYAFHPFMNDSFPATISRLKWVKTVNGVLQNEKSYPILSPIGHLYFGFYLKNSGCTPVTKHLKYQKIYFKP